MPRGRRGESARPQPTVKEGRGRIAGRWARPSEYIGKQATPSAIARLKIDVKPSSRPTHARMRHGRGQPDAGYRRRSAGSTEAGTATRSRRWRAVLGRELDKVARFKKGLETYNLPRTDYPAAQAAPEPVGSARRRRSLKPPAEAQPRATPRAEAPRRSPRASWCQAILPAEGRNPQRDALSRRREAGRESQRETGVPASVTIARRSWSDWAQPTVEGVQ